MCNLCLLAAEDSTPHTELRDSWCEPLLASVGCDHFPHMGIYPWEYPGDAVDETPPGREQVVGDDDLDFRHSQTLCVCAWQWKREFPSGP